MAAFLEKFLQLIPDFCRIVAQTYLRPCLTSIMELFAKIIKGYSRFLFFQESPKQIFKRVLGIYMGYLIILKNSHKNTLSREFFKVKLQPIDQHALSWEMF